MSNSNKVKPADLSNAIMKYLQEYKEDIEEDVVDISNKVTKEARTELKSVSPKANKTVKLKGGTTVAPGSYAKSWSIKNGQKAKEIYSKVVYNRKHYRLTHLLEFGHATRNGGRTKPMPHIRPTEEKYKEEFTQELEKRIKRGN